MTDNLPELPADIIPRHIDLPFEIGPEHVELFTRVVGEAASHPESEGPEWSTARGIEEVVKLVWIEHVLPIEAALAESERDVAAAGRALHEARNR
jgi:hypothetical protein